MNISSGLNFARCGAAFLLLLMLRLQIPAMQNSALGTISGVVQDPTGALIPGSVVIIRNASSEMTWTTHTNESGIFTRPDLPAGTYDSIALVPGYLKPSFVRGTKLGAGETVELKVVLNLGSASFDLLVEVTANPSGTTTICLVDNFPLMGVSSTVCPFGQVFEVSSRLNQAPPIIESDPKYSPQSPLVSMPSFEYPPTARASGFEGTLLFAADIGKDGRTRFIESLSDTGATPFLKNSSGLKDFSKEYIRKWIFKPAERFITIKMIYKIDR